MSTQIAVRLSDDVIEFVDGLVRAGVATSRAEVVHSALRRERRRIQAEEDAAIYARETDDEFAALRAKAGRRKLDID